MTDDQTPPPKPIRKPVTFHLDEALMERLRDAAWWERTPLNVMVTEAVEAHLAMLEKKNGAPFGPRRGDIAKGRPVK